MLILVDHDLPDDDAYGRVTNPERYQVVVDAAHALIDDLIGTYETRTSSGLAETDFPDIRRSPSSVTRLIPAEGARLTFLFTDFPGVVVRAGRWRVESFPVCGCDACDESPSELIESITQLATAVVEGGYQEQLTSRELTYTFSRNGHSWSTVKKPQWGEWRDYGQRCSSRWAVWPKRNVKADPAE